MSLVVFKFCRITKAVPLLHSLYTSTIGYFTLNNERRGKLYTRNTYIVYHVFLEKCNVLGVFKLEASLITIWRKNMLEILQAKMIE